jgi:hypothetical protein
LESGFIWEESVARVSSNAKKAVIDGLSGPGVTQARVKSSGFLTTCEVWKQNFRETKWAE